jgi:hypothetical protein
MITKFEMLYEINKLNGLDLTKLKLNKIVINKDKIIKVKTYESGMFEELITILDYFMDNSLIQNYIISGADIPMIILNDNTEIFYDNFNKLFHKNTINFYIGILNSLNTKVNEPKELNVEENLKKMCIDALNNYNFIYNGVEEEEGGVGYFKNMGFKNITDFRLKTIIEQMPSEMIKTLKSICTNKKK